MSATARTQSQKIQDTQWIEEATLVGDVLLCKDLAICPAPRAQVTADMERHKVRGHPY
jgi:hypothetical protein